MPVKDTQLSDSVEDSLASILLEAKEAGDAIAEGQVINKGEAVRGATEGPLKTLIPIFVDFETPITAEITLRKMTLRQYLAAALREARAGGGIESASIVLGDEDMPVSYFTDAIPGLTPSTPRLDSRVVAALHTVVTDPNYVWVSHNAAFDVRVARFLLGLPQPKNVWCTMEGAMGAWPELPGGYSLDNCSKRLGLPHKHRKFKLDLAELNRVRAKILKTRKDVHISTIPEDVVREFTNILKIRKVNMPELVSLETCALILDIYNCQDVISMREIYMRQIARIPECEQRTALRTHQQRRFYFEINQSNIDSLVATMDENAQYAEQLAKEYLTEDQARDIFNRETDDGSLRSVRYQRLRNVINELREDEEEFESTSLKKLSPIQLAKNPTPNAILEQTSRAGKMISHKRKAAVFHGVEEVDVELGYMRAHTGRFSSPSVGKGLNLHNCVSGSSLILTERGWVRILSLRSGDKLWDGTEFVNFDAVTYEGERTTGKVGLAEVTSEHPVWDGTKMIPAGELTRSQWKRVVVVGFSSMLQGLQMIKCAAAVLDAAERLYEWFNTSRSLLDAVGAPIEDVLECMTSGSLLHSSSSCVHGTTTCVIGPTPSDMIPIQSSGGGNTVVAYAKNGKVTSAVSLNTARRFLAGMTKLSSWIESIMTADTLPGMYDLLIAELTSATAAVLSSPQKANPSWNTAGDSVSNMLPGTAVSNSAVFDIRGVGPRARFVTNGILTSNCPKHDKAIAKPIRQCFSLPDHLCLVRADLANVEYRIEGMLTGCTSVRDMFDETYGGSIFNDPYCLSWKVMTGMDIDSSSPIRQVAKSAVLGLGFCMSPIGYARVILGVLAGKKVTEESLNEIIRANGWKSPPAKVADKIIKFLGCSRTVASAAYHIHRTFNAAHREFGATAQWLVNAIEAVSVAPNNSVEGRDYAKRRLDRVYAHSTAPDRDMINLMIDDDPLPQYPCVRVQCGPWAPTVCWREPHSRPTDFNGGPQNYRLTILKANGFYKSFTRQLAIENVTQAAARNAMCLGLDKLDKLGFPDAIHIHDEIMLVVPRKRENVLAARDAMLNVFGPGHGLPHKWAILVKPHEVSVTKSMYEDEDDIDPAKGDRWGRIERNEPGCLEGLS